MTYRAKLNKRVDGTAYSIQELIILTEGKYDGPLAHNNIANSTIRVYTDSNFTGEEITTFVVSIPVDAPWRRSIRIFADVEVVYVTYQTPGDQVDADDINALQDGVKATQDELTDFKTDGVIDAGFFNERV